MRGLTFAAIALLLAGCAGEAPEGVTEAVSTQTPAVDWETEYRDGTVWVRVVDPRSHYRVESVELVSPEGAAYRAAELTREVERADGYGGAYPSVGVGTGYSSRHGFGTGVGLGIVFPVGRSGTAHPSRTRTEVRIPVPEPDRYARTAQAWTVNVALRDPSGEPRYATIPAPLPRR